MKYISGIINIVIGGFILAVGISFLSDYFGGTEAKIKKFESLLQNGTETIGMVDSMYTEISYKNTKMYSSKYFFDVDGKKYEGDFNVDSPSELMPIIKVLYLADDPSVHDVNIEKQLAEAKKTENSSTNLILGIGASIISLYFLYFKGIRRFRKEQPGAQEKVWMINDFLGF